VVLPDERPPVPRPRTREDCLDMERPCPWVGCRHHLALEVKKKDGVVQVRPMPQVGRQGSTRRRVRGALDRRTTYYMKRLLDRHTLDSEVLTTIDDGRPTCSLDVADAGGATLEDVGLFLGITRERVRQLEAKLAERLRGLPDFMELLRDARAGLLTADVSWAALRAPPAPPQVPVIPMPPPRQPRPIVVRPRPPQEKEQPVPRHDHEGPSEEREERAPAERPRVRRKARRIQPPKARVVPTAAETLEDLQREFNADLTELVDRYRRRVLEVSLSEVRARLDAATEGL